MCSEQGIKPFYRLLNGPKLIFKEQETATTTLTFQLSRSQEILLKGKSAWEYALDIELAFS